MKKLSVHYVHHVPTYIKYMSFNKALAVITSKTNYFYDYISVMPILLLCGLNSLSLVNHL